MSAQSLKPLTADVLSADQIAHGFFTRAGGVSTGLYKGLNCGPGSSDNVAAVAKNRERVANFFKLPNTSLCTLYQIHSAKTVTVTESWGPDVGPQADALVTNQPGIILGILTADCAPVLFADREAQVIGAAHAGWKGALGGVLEATVQEMEALGADRTRLMASIGPCISQENYEVRSDFRNLFTDKNQSFEEFFYDGTTTKKGHYQFDLVAFVESQLHLSELQTIERCSPCTYAHEDQFFSFRRTTHRSEADYGRQISAIVLT